MATTQQSAAVNGLNGVFNLAQQMISLRAQVNDFILKYNDNSWSTVWSNLATAALNADGSLGTADGSPNTSHPINTGLVSGLQSDQSATNYINLVALLEAFQSFLTNQAVATSNRNAILDLFQQG